jgi:hypothetical protein
MSDPNPTLTRRQLLQAAGKASAVVVASPLVGLAIGDDGAPTAQAIAPALTSIAGPDRVVMLNGRTYLNAWAGYGPRPRRGRSGTGQGAAPGAAPPPPPPAGSPRPAPPPPQSIVWIRQA